LSEAESEARQIGSRRSLWVILRDRAGIEDLEGNSSDADRLRSEAAEIVDSLSASLPDADTCRSFEAQPEVRLLRTGKSALRMPS
jgi:hypothetical protein